MSYNPSVIPADAQKVAKKFFEHARTVAESRNYDYAIELYLQGLSKNPEAVDEGHKPLREVGIRRLAMKGKKAGLFEQMKRKSAAKKDPVGEPLLAEFMLAKDPLSIAYAEEMAKGADKCQLPEMLEWALGVCRELAGQDKKLDIKRLLMIKALYEKLGDFHDKHDRPDQAVACLQKGVDTLELAYNSGNRDYDVAGELRDLAGKLTILRGKYGSANDFRDSIKDAGRQRELLDKDRVVKSDDMYENLIGKARQDLAESPTVSGKIIALTDLLTQRGRDEDITEAIKVLLDAESRLTQYSFRMKADDLSLRRMRNELGALKAKAKSDPAAAEAYKKLEAEFIQAEIDSYRLRVKNYPTDMRMKFEFARRLYNAKEYDQAIPVFQEAVSDPKNSANARYYIGACFYQKGWYGQAINVLSKAVESYELEGDNLSKEIYYILGRSQEKLGKKDEAMAAYDKLVQWDFNYRDVRQRIDALQSGTADA